MPYIIKHINRGYILLDKNGHRYSNKPLPLKRVLKQRTAVILAELRKKGWIMGKKDRGGGRCC